MLKLSFKFATDFPKSILFKAIAGFSEDFFSIQILKNENYYFADFNHWHLL